MQKLVITIERTESQVSIYSLDPLIFVARDPVEDGHEMTDRVMLALYGSALEAQRESRSIPA